MLCTLSQVTRLVSSLDCFETKWSDSRVHTLRWVPWWTALSHLPSPLNQLHFWGKPVFSYISLTFIEFLLCAGTGLGTERVTNKTMSLHCGCWVAKSCLTFANSCDQSPPPPHPWTVAPQPPLSMGFPSPGDLPNPGMEPASLAPHALADGVLTTAQPGKPLPLSHQGLKNSGERQMFKKRGEKKKKSTELPDLIVKELQGGE